MTTLPRCGLLSLLLCALLNACGPVGCSAVFVTYSLKVTSKDGTPVLLDSITVTNLETGKPYPACNTRHTNFPCLGLNPSEDFPSYQIMNDGFNKTLKRSGTRVLVEGAKGDSTFSEGYVFSSGPCHVQIESGSLEITLE